MKKKIIIGSCITLVIILFVSVFLINNSDSSSVFGGGGILDVKVKNIGRGDIKSSVNASGVTQTTEDMEIYLDASLKINKVFKTENQSVRKGEKIVDLDLSELNSQLEQLKLSRDIQAIAIQKLKDMSGQKNLDIAVSIAKNSLENAKENYEDSKKNYEDSLDAYAYLEISAEELDAAKKALAAAKLALDNANSNYQAAVENFNSAQRGNSTDLETQEKNLQASELKISDLETKIKKITESMISPMDGVISQISIKEGSYTSSMQPAFVIINTSKLNIKAKVKEFDIKSVAVGQEVKITGDAIDKEAKVTGRLESISPFAKKNTTMSGEETVVEAVISIEQSDVQLKSGLNVSCEIFTIDKKGVLVVDFEMIKEDKDGSKFVYVVDKDNIMHKRQINLGTNSDMTSEVISGLSEGEAVVTRPLPNYKDGAKVRAENVTKSEAK
jgi:RND family efflux transporter MFP subunit